MSYEALVAARLRKKKNDIRRNRLIKKRNKLAFFPKKLIKINCCKRKKKSNKHNRKSKDGKKQELDSSPPYQANELKNTRFREETKLKLLTWNLDTPRSEFVEQLKDQLVAANFNKSLMTMIFHADFKQLLKALEMLVGFVESDIEALIANLDHIL